MEYELVIRPEAKVDLLDTFQWYQDQAPDLGYDFKSCVDEVISKILENPRIYKQVFLDIRRAVIKSFPFGVFYMIEDQKIIVLGVLHARRDPLTWKNRI